MFKGSIILSSMPHAVHFLPRVLKFFLCFVRILPEFLARKAECSFNTISKDGARMHDRSCMPPALHMVQWRKTFADL